MSVIGATAVADICARTARRLAAIDPLLPETVDLPPGCGARFAAGAAGGAPGSDQPAAIASCDYWEGEPGSIGRSWGASRRFRLVPAIAEPDVAPALDSLIHQWREH